MSEESKTLEDAFTNIQQAPSSNDREHHANTPWGDRSFLYPVYRLGDLGIDDPSSISDQHYNDSLDDNQPLTDTIFEQQNDLSAETIALLQPKNQ